MDGGEEEPDALVREEQFSSRARSLRVKFAPSEEIELLVWIPFF